MKYRSSKHFAWIILLSLFCSYTAAEECKFMGGQIQGKMFCNVSENAAIGTEALCEIIILENGQKLTSDKNTPLKVQLDEKSKHVQFIVTANLSLYLIDQNSTGESPANLVNQPIFCSTGGDSLHGVITIIPQNNHDPTFSHEEYAAEIKETAEIGHVLKINSPIVVTDWDYRDGVNSEVNSDVTVSITAGNDDEAFEVTASRRETRERYPSTFDVTLKLVKSISYKKDGFTFELKAQDKATPPRSSTAKVKIKIIYFDNQDPVFVHPVYTSDLYLTEKEKNKLFVSNTDTDSGIEFKEEFPLKLSPDKFFAFDQDLGINATIFYEMVSDNVQFASYFNVDKKNARLTLKKLKIEEIKKFITATYIGLLIKAYQEDDPKRHAFALVNVNVNAKLIGRQPSYTQKLEILRNQPLNVAFHTVESSGDDLKYEISGENSAMFGFLGNELYLKTNIGQNITTLEMNVTVTSSQSMIQTNNTMKIVFDVVERKSSGFKSLFKKDVYVVDVPLDSSIDSELFEIETTDSNITIIITKIEPDNATNTFVINSNKITLKKNMDPSITSYKIHITGNHTENTEMNDTAVVFLNVLQTNRSASLFGRSHYRVDVFECTIPGTQVFSFDDLLADDVTIQIDNNQTEYFNFNETSRNITLAKKINLEDKFYKLYVTGTSEINQTDTIMITFYVRECVKFTGYLDKCVYIAKLESRFSAGRVLMTFTEYSDVYYTIESGDKYGEFTMDKNGLLKLRVAGSGLKRDVYYIVVTATKKITRTSSHGPEGIPEVNKEDSLVVFTVEQEPEFLHPQPLIKVFAPSALLSEYVFQIQVKPTARQVTYSVDNNTNFHINKDTGLIYPVNDVTKINGLHDVFKVTAEYNDYQKSTLTVHIFRLTWAQTLLMTSSLASPELPKPIDIEKKIKTTASVTGCVITILTYQIIEGVRRENFGKSRTENKLELVISAIKNNSTVLTLQQFNNLSFNKEYLEGVIGKFDMTQLPEHNETQYFLVDANNDGLVAGVTILGVILFIVILLILLLFYSQRYSVHIPLISAIPDWVKRPAERTPGNNTVQNGTIMKEWKPPTPPLRRIGNEYSATSLNGVDNNSFQNDNETKTKTANKSSNIKTKTEENYYIDVIADDEPYTDARSQTRNDETTTKAPSSEDNKQNENEKLNEQRKSIVTFSEQAQIIP